MSREQLQTDLSDAVRLERIDPERNAYRFYHGVLWPDLFGGVALVREWGGSGRAARCAAIHTPTAARRGKPCKSSSGASAGAAIR